MDLLNRKKHLQDREKYILEQVKKINRNDLREFAELSETKRVLRRLDNINPRLAELKQSLKIIALYL
jgi:predicted KAP-like P-loop ATPase